jgi:hypothetical protein
MGIYQGIRVSIVIDLTFYDACSYIYTYRVRIPYLYQLKENDPGRDRVSRTNAATNYFLCPVGRIAEPCPATVLLCSA